MIIVLCCWATGMTAQSNKGGFSVKPMAGINISNFAGGTDGLYKSKVGFTGGVEMEYGVNEWLGLSLGALYSQQGAKMEGSFQMMYDNNGKNETVLVSTKGKVKGDYLNLPLIANIYIPAVKGLSVKAGLQLGILMHDRLEETDIIVLVREPTSNPYEMTLADPNQVQVSESYVSKNDVLKSIDLGIPVGLSYEYSNIVLDARYYFGLTKIDNTPEPEDVRNRHFSITLGYRFHL